MADKPVPAVEKALDIIDLLAENPEKYLGVSEIAGILNYNKSTTYSILTTLVDRNWLEKDPISSKYGLSTGIYQLSSKYEFKNRTISDFKLIGRSLSEKCGELINLHFIKGFSSVILISSIPSLDHSLKVELPIGTIIPAAPSSAGKCLISDFDDEALGNIFEQWNIYHMGNTIMNKEEFISTVHQVRLNGYSTNLGEYERGIYSVGAPIRNASGAIVAAINIVVPEARFSERKKSELIELVKYGATELSKLRGWQESKRFK